MTRDEIQILIDNYIVPNGNVLASEHNEIETALNRDLVHKDEFNTLYEAAAKGAMYIFQTKADLDAYDTSGVSTGERALVLADENQGDESTIYEWDGASWIFVGELGSLGDAENKFVSKTGVASEDIEGLKTFLTAIPKIDSSLTVTDGDELTDKDYVDNAIAAAGVSGQTVKVSMNDTTAGYLFNKITNSDSKVSIIISNAGMDEDLVINLNEGSIDHDALLNFLTDEHIGHSTVSITGTSGLGGGGDLTASRTIVVDIANTPTITTLDGSDEILIADVSNSNVIRKTTIDDILSGVVSDVLIYNEAPYWYNTINNQTSDYLYDDDANADSKNFLRIDDVVGESYEITKANFYYIDDVPQEVTSPQIHIVRNRGGVYTNMCTGVLTINPGDNDLTTILTTNSWLNGDSIEIYIDTGTGTPLGSAIYGYFKWVVKKV